SVTADGAYDTRKCHDAIAERGAHAVIPPRRNAKPWKVINSWRGRPRRGPARREIPRPGPLATMERIPPPEPRRDQDALCETAGPAAHGTGLRPTGRRAPSPHRRPERLHRARHTHNWLDKFGLQVVIKTSEMLGAVLRSGANVDLLALDERGWAASGGAGFSVLSAGEAAFRESLRDLQRRHGGSTGGPQAHFGRFYQWLYSGAKAQQYDRVRDIVHDHITSSYPIATGTVVLGKPCVRRRVHSVASAAKEAGLHPKRLRSILEAEGFLQSPSGASRNDGEYLFDAELVRPLLINTSMSVCQGRAQRELGISRSQFDVMRKWGFVAPVSETAKAKPRYSVLAIREFRKKILRHAETVAVPEAGQSDLQTAARKVVCSTGEIVTLILSNHLKFVGCLPRQRNFGGLLVDVEEVRAKLAIPPDDGLTKPELQKRLHASYAMVKWLCDEGYLPLERSRSRASKGAGGRHDRRICCVGLCQEESRDALRPPQAYTRSRPPSPPRTERRQGRVPYSGNRPQPPQTRQAEAVTGLRHQQGRSA
ncbi:hypothetical protein SAMN04488105_13521, partial [Salipiger thiooxidans]